MTTTYTRVTKPLVPWVDITVANAALKSVAIVLRNEGNTQLDVFFGGAAAPNTTNTGDGHKLLPGEEISGNAANIWVLYAGVFTARLA